MKNVYKYIIGFALACVVAVTTATTVNAEAEAIMCGEAFNVGDRIYYYGRKFTTNASGDVLYDQYLLYDELATSTTYRACIYLVDNSSTESGKVFQVYNNMLSASLYNTEDNSLDSSGFGLNGYAPTEYVITFNGKVYYETVEFSTNIPIFENKEDATTYYETGEGLNKAINYKKVYSNGSWVRPFEDIEINDSNIPVPVLTDVSHNGFTVDPPDERYMCDIYLESGIQNPGSYVKGTTSVGSAYCVNSFGLISDIEGAYSGTIKLDANYGVDNQGALLSSCNEFFDIFPSLKVWRESDSIYLLDKTTGANKTTFSIWGYPFGKKYIFWSEGTEVGGDVVDIDDIPIAYTNYKVRYYYYDDDTGFHYGPWTNFIYFSDSRVFSNYIYEDNNGGVLETPVEIGKQDENGNVTVGSTDLANWIDIDNPNELFGYLRSVINNVNATGSSFMTLFATVFTFIPSEIQLIIWLGIGCMILIGIVKALSG